MYAFVLWFCIYLFAATVVPPLLCALKKSRWLITEEELLEFQALFERRSGGSSVGLEYLRSSRVRGYRKKTGSLAAGYVINAQAPLRYFSWLDPEDREKRLGDAVTEKDLVEITCIVFDSRQINYVDRGRIYLESILLAMKTGKPFLLGGSFVPKVRDLQMACMPRPFRSVTSTYRGRPEPVWLYYGAAQEVPMKFMCFTLSVVLRDTLCFFGLPVAHPLWNNKRNKSGFAAKP